MFVLPTKELRFCMVFVLPTEELRFCMVFLLPTGELRLHGVCANAGAVQGHSALDREPPDP